MCVCGRGTLELCPLSLYNMSRFGDVSDMLVVAFDFVGSKGSLIVHLESSNGVAYRYCRSLSLSVA